MHPVLFHIPVPRWHVPLALPLLAFGVLVAAVSLAGFRGRSKQENALRGLGVVALGLAALTGRGQELVLAPVAVPAFGALLALSLGLGVALGARLAERAGMARTAATKSLLAAAAAGVVGARLTYLSLHPGELGSPGSVLAFYDGGLFGPGGVLAGALVAGLAAKRAGLRPLALFDAISPLLGVGVTLTRLGCWLEGCDYGRALGAGAPALIARLGTFPASSRAWTEQVLAGALAPTANRAVPVHPTELYEALGGAALALLALVIRQRQQRIGVAAVTTLAGYGLLSLLVGLVRAPSPESWSVRVLLLVALLATLVIRARRERQQPAV